MKLSSFKVGPRLITGFVIVSAIGAGIGAIGIGGMGAINEEADKLYQRDLLGVSYIKEANVQLLAVGRSMNNAVLTDSAAERERYVTLIEENMTKVRDQVALAKPLYYSEAGKAEVAAVEKSLADYDRLITEFKAKLAAEQLSQTRESVVFLQGEVRQLVNTLDEQMTRLTQRKEANAKATAAETTALFEHSRNLMLVLIAAGVLAGVALGWTISRSITRPLSGGVASARRMAEGDLSSEIVVEGRDEIAELLAAIKTTQAKIAGIVTDVRANAEGVATASAQIAQGNNDLSGRTEEQASALEETAASMEELASTVRQNADNAQQGNQLAQGASTVAAKGGAVVGQVVETMAGINASSKKIADIISVIDGIAFQTNILALNAAVEAARAGEQGRGFAVVASEVRNLAQRSASAAKEIKDLINDSVGRVEQGSALVDQAGATMTEVVSAIKRVTDIMGEISSASTEQSAGVAQIGEAVQQMDQATQQNAALVEESAAAAESLKAQAQHLVDAVAVFKLAAGQQGGVAVAAARPAAKPATGWDGSERRGPDRARNVTRLQPKAAPVKPGKPAESAAAPAAAAKTGTDDWQSF